MCKNLISAHIFLEIPAAKFRMPDKERLKIISAKIAMRLIKFMELALKFQRWHKKFILIRRGHPQN